MERLVRENTPMPAIAARTIAVCHTGAAVLAAVECVGEGAGAGLASMDRLRCLRSGSGYEVEEGKVHPRNMPAIEALIKLAMVPAIMARTPSLARSWRRSGMSAPMPPIWMPMEPRLANPQRAKVAMVKDRVLMAAF